MKVNVFSLHIDHIFGKLTNLKTDLHIFYHLATHILMDKNMLHQGMCQYNYVCILHCLRHIYHRGKLWKKYKSYMKINEIGMLSWLNHLFILSINTGLNYRAQLDVRFYRSRPVHALLQLSHLRRLCKRSHIYIRGWVRTLYIMCECDHSAHILL